MVRPVTLKVGLGDLSLAAGHGFPTLRFAVVARLVSVTASVSPRPGARYVVHVKALPTETLRKNIGVYRLGKAEHNKVEIATTHGIRLRRCR